MVFTIFVQIKFNRAHRFLSTFVKFFYSKSLCLLFIAGSSWTALLFLSCSSPRSLLSRRRRVVPNGRLRQPRHFRQFRWTDPETTARRYDEDRQIVPKVFHSPSEIRFPPPLHFPRLNCAFICLFIFTMLLVCTFPDCEYSWSPYLGPNILPIRGRQMWGVKKTMR